MGAKDTFPAAAKGANDLRLAVQVERAIPKFSFGKSGTAAAQTAKPDAARRVLQRNGQWRDDIPVYAMASLKAGDSAAGPALIEDAYFTCRILDGWTFSVNENRDIVARRTGSAAK